VRRPSHEHLDVRGAERLRQVVPRSGAQRVEARRHRRVAGHHHDERPRIASVDGAQHVHAAHRRHVQVDQRDVEMLAPCRLDGILATGERHDLVPVHAEDVGASLSQRPIVVHHEDAQGGAGRLRRLRRLLGGARPAGGGRQRTGGSRHGRGACGGSGGPIGMSLARSVARRGGQARTAALLHRRACREEWRRVYRCCIDRATRFLELPWRRAVR
jgi:hypothetical protein